MKSFATIILLLVSFPVFSSAMFAAESGRRGAAEWEKTIEAAKKEGQLTIYYWGSPLVVDSGAFQKAYPEIKITTISGIGNQLMQRIFAERRGEKFIPDVYIAGIATMAVLSRAKILDPIKPALLLPEVTDESKWWHGKHLYGDAEGSHVFTFSKGPNYGSIAFNPKLMNPREIGSYWDFLQPKWKSKIAVRDLRDGGPGSTPLRFMYYSPDLGPKFVKQLYGGMDATLFRDNRLALDWVASGKYSIAFYVQNVEKAEEKGLPVQLFTRSLKEGVALSSGVGHMALLNRAPHPNAAKVFINWFLSREGQALYQKLQVEAKAPADSLRVDIPKDDIPLADRRQDGVKYLDTDDAKVSDPKPVIQIIKEILSESEK